MYIEQQPIFKDLCPYSGGIDTKNRWIKLSKLVPWDEIEPIYRKHFDNSKQTVIKSCRLIMGLILGQMLMKLSDVDIVDYFHENPYFQYFCGETTFIPKLDKRVIHPSLLSKRRHRLGEKYAKAFENEIIKALKKEGLVKGKKLILDATVFPADITYPNDVKLLNTVRDYLCKTILIVKNSIDPTRKIRTYRKVARRCYLNFQKTKRKSSQFIRRTRKSMIQYVDRNIQQLDGLLAELQIKMNQNVPLFKQWHYDHILEQIAVSKTILEQQIHMATTRGRSVANRIVSFHRPEIRPVVRGKEGTSVEFGPKAHIALVDGYAILDDCQFEPFNEGIRLVDSLESHRVRFDRNPELILADQLYANRYNRQHLNELSISHSFKRTGRPPNESPTEKQKHQRTFRKRQGQRNHVEATIGHLKNDFNLDKVTWSVPGGAIMQIHFGLIASNLHKASLAMT